MNTYYLHPSTARALLALSRAYTQRKRAERAAMRELFAEFSRIGFCPKAAQELAQIQQTIKE